MSDMMNPAAVKPTALDRTRSLLNPTDMAMGLTQTGGQVPTIKDFVTNVLKVPGGVDAPITELARVLKAQPQNATPIGKVRSMAQQGQPAPAPAPQTGPSMGGGMGGATPPALQGMDALIQKLGR